MNLAVSDNIAIFAPFPHARMANFNVPYSTRLLDTLARVYVNVMLFYALHVCVCVLNSRATTKYDSFLFDLLLL